MTIAFILTMPGVASWNGKWSGEGKLYAVLRRYTSKRAKEERAALDGKNFYYRWSDGWAANVRCKIVTPAEARKIAKESAGFCGYEWMVDEILTHGRIRSETERDAAEAVSQ